MFWIPLHDAVRAAISSAITFNCGHRFLLPRRNEDSLEATYCLVDLTTSKWLVVNVWERADLCSLSPSTAMSHWWKATLFFKGNEYLILCLIDGDLISSSLTNHIFKKYTLLHLNNLFSPCKNEMLNPTILIEVIILNVLSSKFYCNYYCKLNLVHQKPFWHSPTEKM